MTERHDEESPTLAEAVENGFELVRLLELVGEKCARAGAWKWHVILLTVDLPEPFLVGADLPRLWMKRAGTEEYLHGVDTGELVARYYGAAPVVRLDAPIWRFEPLSSAPLAERFTQVREPRQLARVRRAVQASAQDLRGFKRAHRAEVARWPDAPAWQTCPICSPRVESSFRAPPADDPRPAEVPVRQRYLQILGAPVFTDTTSRGWCVKRCPHCHTHYLWQSDYQYFVNGATEDETTFTRLTDDEAQPWLRQVEAAVRA